LQSDRSGLSGKDILFFVVQLHSKSFNRCT
jgi:hypothetical protein